MHVKFLLKNLVYAFGSKILLPLKDQKKPMNTIIKSIETDFGQIDLLASKIGHVHFKANIEINKKIQFQLLESYKQLTEYPIPFIYTSDEFLSSTKDAPKHAKIVEKQSPINMKVLVVQNLAQRILAKFYYKIHKPINPYKVCPSFDDGIKWINDNRNNLNPAL